MRDDTTQQSVLFADLSNKAVVAQFDRHHASSDGGAVLLGAADRRLGLTERLAEALRDDRQAGKVKHDITDLLRQRVYAIACGYPDCNDAARLADDPIHKLLIDRDPVEGDPLASQPTLSRFENSIRRTDLFRLGEAVADAVIERHRQRLGKKVKRVTIDLDPTDDPTHGAQQLSFFNGHYCSWCYLPVVGFLTFNDEPDQYLFTAVLRAGNASAHLGAIGILKRVIEKLDEAFPGVKILVRLDGGFASPQIFEFLDEAGLDYAIAMAGNSVLRGRAEKMMRKARRLSHQSGQTEHLYGECRYRAGRWDRARRVVIKAEVVRHPGREPKDNPRFVITNLRADPRKSYTRVYCGRGEIENRIKELHHGLEMDRTSCSRFWANQFRVLMTAAAYVLMQEIRQKARRTSCARAQVWTLRERLIKLGVWVEVSVRRIVLHLPASFPFLQEWRRIAVAVGASP